MPKSSMAGSIFPDLEQEQTSTAHPRRNQGEAGKKSSKKACKTEKRKQTES